MKERKQRTLSQNASLHLGCQQIADELIANGVSLDIALRGLDVRPTMTAIKDVFRQIAGAKFGVESTADLKTNEINEVWEDLVKALSQNTGVQFDFPSEEGREEAMQSLDRSINR